MDDLQYKICSYMHQIGNSPKIVYVFQSPRYNRSLGISQKRYNMPEIQTHQHPDIAPELLTEGYPRRVCQYIALGARKIAETPLGSPVNQDNLHYIQSFVHMRIRSILEGKDNASLNAAELQLLEYVTTFKPELLSKDARILRGNFNGSPSAFLIDIRRHLGKGGINDVYEGIEISSGRRITVRKIHNFNYRNSFIGQDDVSSASRAQAVMLKIPPHEDVVRFWGTAFDDEQNEYTIYDFAEGMNMDVYLRTTKDVITYDNFRTMALGAASGVYHYHQHGLIHGDVKPENCIVNVRNRNEANVSESSTTDDLHTCIIDMDIMRTWQDYIRDIKLGKCAGTPLYIPPDVFHSDLVPKDLKEQRIMAEACDVYALGLTFYNMLTGSYPAEIKNVLPMNLIAAKSNEMSFDALEGEPLWLKNLIVSMCSHDWRQRPTMQLVVEILTFGFEESDRSLPLKAITDQPKTEILDMPTTHETCLYKEPHIGRYIIVDDAFAQKIVETGETLQLAKLEDETFKMEKIGIPYEFFDEVVARGFFEQKKVFFQRLNNVREENPELFPDTFDLYLQTPEGDGPYTVWVIRGLVKDKILLDQYMDEHFSECTMYEKWELLIRISDSLAALESAGYRHPNLTPQNIFLAPPDYIKNKMGQTIISPATICGLPFCTVENGGRIMNKEGFFQFPKGLIYYRLELMDTSMAVEIVEGEDDPCIDQFIDIVLDFLTREHAISNVSMQRCTELIAQLKDKTLSWKDRTALLREEQCLYKKK